MTQRIISTARSIGEGAFPLLGTLTAGFVMASVAIIAV
jgi:hypothetical protein